MDKNEGIQPEHMKLGMQPAPADALQARPPVDDDAPDDEGRFFSPGNVIMMVILLAIAALIWTKFSGIEIWAICKAAIGLSFVIFIHELGHFLAAKWCDVNVTTFSIGFGPAIPGCRFRWGETTYKLGILPLGGYVQMVGQIDGDESSDGSEDDPRSYRAKTVWQRMLIISAGVIMNAILAVICFIGVYMGPGKEQMAGVIGNVDTHGPGFQKGLRTGAVIERVGSVSNPTFPDLMQTVINTTRDEAIDIVIQRPDDKEPIATTIKPRKEADDLRPMIGIVSPSRLKFVTDRDTREGPAWPGTPAAKADFKHGDVIVGMTDPGQDWGKEYDPNRVTPLRDDPRYPNHDQKDYFQFMERLQLLADKPVVVQVRRMVKDAPTLVDVRVQPMYRISYGAVMQMGPILAVREGSAAAAPDKGVRTPDADKKLEGDRIEAVSVVDVDGKKIEYKGEALDPERLPQQLRQWSDRMHAAKKEMTVTLHVRRHREGGGMQFEQKSIELPWDYGWRFDRVGPFSLDAPAPIPELGLAYQIKTTVAAVLPGTKCPLEAGDEIKNIRYDYEGQKDDARWMNKDLESGQWANISARVFQLPIVFKKLTFKVKRGNEMKELDIPFVEDHGCPIVDRGWILLSDTRRVKADDPYQAVVMGFNDTRNRMMEVFQNLRGMLSGRLSVKNFGGPITIAYATYRFAGMDYGELIFFLGLISINLAVVNFLPIPVLDGGHMVFLIYEKLRGKPASEGIRTAATLVGLAMIAALMLFVSYLDVMRHFFS